MAVTIADLAERVLRRLGVAVVAAADRPSLAAVVPVETIARRALEWLGVAPADEVLAPDLDLAVSRLHAVHDSLVAQAIVSWAADAIPRAVSEDYVMLTALHLAMAFGKTGDAAQEAAREARIRRVAAIMRSQGWAEQALMDVHASLDARGRTRWTSFDIPDQAAPAYVDMAAAQLAPEFGVTPDATAQARGEMMISRLIALPSDGRHPAVEFF